MILSCVPTMVTPTILHGYRCMNQPVLLPEEKKGTPPTHFHELLTHQILTTCDPVTCSNALPVTFYINNKEPICQTPSGIIKCHAGTIIHPTDTVPPKFRPLTVSQQTLSSTEGMLSDHLMLMMEEISTSSNFANGLLNRLSHNVLTCNDEEHCSNHVPFSQQTRRELSRMTLSNPEHFFTWTTMGNILLYLFYGGVLHA